MAHYPTACLSTSAAAIPLPPSERERLLASVDKWICRVVNGAGLPAAEVEDVIQDCRLEVWKASERFDPARGIAFTTFAGHVVRRRLAEFRRNKATHGGPAAVHPEVPESIPDPAGWDGNVDDGTEAAFGPEDADMEARIRALAAGEWLSVLTDSQKRLFELVALRGLTAPQAAAQIGVKLSIVEIALRGIVKKIEGHLSPALAAKLEKWKADDAVAPARKARYAKGREWKPKEKRPAAEKPDPGEKPAAEGK